MRELALILLGTALLDNIVLIQFLGASPLAGSNRFHNAMALGQATAAVLVPASILAWLIDHLLLIPLQLAYLRLPAMLLLIALLAQTAVLLLRSHRPQWQAMPGVQLPLIAGNSLLLGVILLNATQQRSLLQSLAQGIGASAGFLLALALLAALHERIDMSAVPAPFRGTAIMLISIGLMSLGFLGFTGTT